MSHLSDDTLVLHYYGEDGSEMLIVERHLESCAQCAREFEALTRALNLVTSPEFVEAPDDKAALRQMLRERVPLQSWPITAAPRTLRAEAGAIAVAWLVPLLYPWSLPALFASVQWAHEQVAGIALVALTVLWACAGPIVAALVLHGVAGSFDRISTRLRVLGAMMAVVTPPLFMLTRGAQSLSGWYGALGVAAVLALVPWPQLPVHTLRLRYVHRLSAAVLGFFVLAHIVNQSLAFVSVSLYAAMRSVMRVASQQSISYVIIVTAAGVQIATGLSMSLTNVRAGAVARSLQTISGWYLAVFLLSHVFAGFLFSRPAGVPAVATSPVPPYVLANSAATALLPYYVLGVAAFLLHVGVYARLVALAYLAEASVRRLSYAAALLGTTVVVTVGLALCGIRVFG